MFESISGMNLRRKAAFFLTAYYFLAAFMPFSHAHAIEESHLVSLHVVIDDSQPNHSHDDDHDHHHHRKNEHQHSHEDGVSGQCCRPAPVDSDHHHFISEFFHYLSERRKLLNHNAAPVVQSVSFSSGFISATPADQADVTILPDIPAWPRRHFFRRVSGNSPPATFFSLSE